MALLRFTESSGEALGAIFGDKGGTAQDVTSQKLRVQYFHPADAETDALAAQDAAYEAEEAVARVG